MKQDSSCGERPAVNAREGPVTAQADVPSPRSLHPSDWWIFGLPIVAALDLALYLTLRSRPGAMAVWLWTWAPAALMTSIAVLLVGALLSAMRSRRAWTWYHGAAFAGTVALVPTVTAYLAYPSSYDDRPSAVEFRLPLEGPVTIAWGGATHRVNYHVASPSERWAFDLLVTVDGRSHRGEERDVRSYFAYGRPVLAPADGTVVAVRDGEPDAVPGRPERHRRAGNHVVLQVAPGEYLFIAHLQAGSLTVRPGDRVRSGQMLGRVGNSGNTTEPHVHLHLQDTPVPDAGEGIPLLFTAYRIAGAPEVIARGMPRGGQRRGQFHGQIVESSHEVR